MYYIESGTACAQYRHTVPEISFLYPQWRRIIPTPIYKHIAVGKAAITLKRDIK